MISSITEMIRNGMITTTIPMIRSPVQIAMSISMPCF